MDSLSIEWQWLQFYRIFDHPTSKVWRATVFLLLRPSHGGFIIELMKCPTLPLHFKLRRASILTANKGLLVHKKSPFLWWDRGHIAIRTTLSWCTKPRGRRAPKMKNETFFFAKIDYILNLTQCFGPCRKIIRPFWPPEHFYGLEILSLFEMPD